MRAVAWRAFVLASCLCLGLSACSPRQMVIGGVADELAHAGLAAEPDLALARDAAPFYLKLSESMLLRQPGHVGLATSVSAGFTQYAYAFVAFEADRVEAQDAQAATRLRQRAAALYARATRHALAALESRHPAFRTRLHLFAAPPEALAAAPSAVEAAVARLDPDTLSPREALDALYQLKKLLK